MTQYTARQLIETKRQEAIAKGVEPYAVLLSSEILDAVYNVRFELGAVEIIHDIRLPAREDESRVVWWDERDYQKASETVHCSYR